VAATVLVDRGMSPVDHAVAAATAIVASSPPLNGAVLLPPNEFVVDARTLAVLPLAPAGGEAFSADVRTRAFAAALERKIIAALRSVPGLHLLDAAAVPASAAAELAPSAIGTLIGARAIVRGTMRETAEGLEIELALLDAVTDTLLWKSSYRARATSAIAADAIPSIAAALVATTEDDARAASAREINALTSFGEAEGAIE
jgi:TolB-like protein